VGSGSTATARNRSSRGATQIEDLEAFPAGEKKHIFIAGVDGCLATLDLIRSGLADQSSNQPISRRTSRSVIFIAADYSERNWNVGAVDQQTDHHGRGVRHRADRKVDPPVSSTQVIPTAMMPM